jgi:hypothetical protein
VLFTSFEPQPNPQKEGKCQLQGERDAKLQLQGERLAKLQLQGERLDRQPLPQFACALKKPPLTKTSESAIAKISFLLIFISLKF